MKKICMFSAIVLLFLLTGCGSIGNPLELVGIWKYDVSPTKSGTYDFKSDGSVIFTDDNAGTLSVSKGIYIGDIGSTGEKVITIYYTEQTVGSIKTPVTIQFSYYYSISLLGTKSYLNLKTWTDSAPSRWTKQ